MTISAMEIEKMLTATTTLLCRKLTQKLASWESRELISWGEAQTVGETCKNSHPGITVSDCFLRDFGGSCWIRTSDQLVKSQLLYQLS